MVKQIKERLQKSMFDVEILGRVKHKERVQFMCVDILHKLMPRTTKDVDITVSFVNECDNNVAGDCYGDNEEVHINIARKSYDYEYSFNEQMLTLCHELVHAKQFIKGELTGSGHVWKGVDMSLIRGIEKQPWEQEAFDLETKLFDRYVSMF